MAATLRAAASRGLAFALRGSSPSPASVRQRSGGGPVLTVSPQSSLADESLSVAVRGLEPQQRVTLRAQVFSEQDCLFNSCAHYQADEGGCVDLATALSAGGDYTGVEPMGLFWALAPAGMEKPHQRLEQTEVVESPMIVEMLVHEGFSQAKSSIHGPVLARMKVERQFARPGVRKIRLREGVVRGSLFIPAGDGPFPGVIDMFGDEGGLLEFRSSLLANRGFAALALPYFGFEDLPVSMKDFQLEYFENAVRFLQRHPKMILNSAIGLTLPKVWRAYGGIRRCLKNGPELGSYGSILKNARSCISDSGEASFGILCTVLETPPRIYYQI